MGKIGHGARYFFSFHQLTPVHLLRKGQEVSSGSPDQGEIFNVAGQGIGNGGFDQVEAFVKLLADQITRTLHDVGVVSRASLHGVRTQATVQDVVARQAGE